MFVGAEYKLKTWFDIYCVTLRMLNSPVAYFSTHHLTWRGWFSGTNVTWTTEDKCLKREERKWEFLNCFCSFTFSNRYLFFVVWEFIGKTVVIFLFSVVGNWLWDQVFRNKCKIQCKCRGVFFHPWQGHYGPTQQKNGKSFCVTVSYKMEISGTGCTMVSEHALYTINHSYDIFNKLLLASLRTAPIANLFKLLI